MTHYSILHIWNQAGVASVLAKWQTKQGHYTKVITNSKNDRMNITKYYDGIVIKNKVMFVLKSILMARHFDIIHLHDAWFVVIPIRLLFPNKKIIMHYHGSLIRKKMKETRRKIWEKFVDMIILSTPDLLDCKFYTRKNIMIHHLENPIDTELFAQRNNIKQNNNALILLKKDQSFFETKDLLKKYNLNYDLIPLTDKVDYKDFPDKLSLYSYYVDFPMSEGKIIPASSICGLQALSIGLTVIDHAGLKQRRLPYLNHPENTVKFLDELYDYIYTNNTIVI